MSGKSSTSSEWQTASLPPHPCPKKLFYMLQLMKKHTKLILTPSYKSSAPSCMPCWEPDLTLPMPSAPSHTLLHAPGCHMFRLSSTFFDTSRALLAMGSLTPMMEACSPHHSKTTSTDTWT